MFKNKLNEIKDVNERGRVRVVAPSYPTSWVNIRLVLISISL